MREVHKSLKNSVNAFLFRPDFTVGTALTELENLNVLGVNINSLG